MARVDCVFDIDTPLGGDLSGPMFDDGAGNRKPFRKNENSAPAADQLFVIVRWNAGGAGPPQLIGDVVFSMSQNARPNQNAASPFKNAIGGQLCHQRVTVNRQAGNPANGNLPFYEFGSFDLVKGIHPVGSQQGSYELTFVAELPGAPAGQEVQWAQDPEFDVGG